MNITTITEDGKFVIPLTKPKTTKQMAFWDYVGSIKFKGKYDPEADRETMMNEVAEHALEKDA